MYFEDPMSALRNVVASNCEYIIWLSERLFNRITSSKDGVCSQEGISRLVETVAIED